MNRSALVRGGAIVQTTLGGIRTLWTRTDIRLPFEPTWEDVDTSMYGIVDAVVTDRVYKVPLRLWGAWENLDLLFPSAVLAPIPGTSLFGANDVAWSFLGRNGDKITFTNMAIVGLANLYLGVNQPLFAADVTLAGILGNNLAPEAANSYYTVQTGQAFSDNQFSKANYKRLRSSGLWGAFAGFQSIEPKEGVNISWSMDVQQDKADGYGTVDMFLGDKGMIGNCTAIPIGNSLAQLEAAAQAQGTQLGSLLSNLSGDLSWTGNGGSPLVTLKNAAVIKHEYVFGAKPVRQGPVTWKTTRGFAAGAPAAVALVA